MLTQSEADLLLRMSKRFADPVYALAMPPGHDESHELVGNDSGDERFLLDTRGCRRTMKLKFQTRSRKVFILARLDIEGGPHTNPDGQRLGGTHLHLYREGFDDKWAAPLDPVLFPDTSSIATAFQDFCRLCAIREPPTVGETLL